MTKKLIYLIFNIIFSITVFISVFNIEKLTTILIILLIITPNIVDIITYRSVNKRFQNLKLAPLNTTYLNYSLILQIISLIFFVFGIINRSTFLLSIFVILYTIAYKLPAYSYVQFNSDVFIFSKYIIEIKKIQKISEYMNKLQIIYFDNSVFQIKFRDENEVKLAKKILKGKYK